MRIELILGGITRDMHLSKEYPTAEEAADGLAQMINIVSQIAFPIVSIKINNKEVPIPNNFESITIDTVDYE